MNSKQLQYAIELSKHLNFSQVAEQFHISQPALSKQISSLEGELGVKLFDRSSSPITLTPAGEHFVRDAQTLLHKEEMLFQDMEQYKSGQRGRLTIGISPFRCLYLMPPILKKIRKKYPGVQIFLHEAPSGQLRKEAAEGKYDFAIVNLPVDNSVLDTIPLEPDTLVFVVPKALARSIPKEKYHQGLPVISLEQCRHLPFIVVSNTQEMRLLFENLCALSDVQPNIVMEVVGLTTAWTMAHAGIGATILPLQFVNNEIDDQKVELFSLDSCVTSRQPVIVTRRGQVLSPYAKQAIALLTQSNGSGFTS